MPAVGYVALRAAYLATLRATELVTRSSAAATAILNGLMTEALTIDEQSDLTVRLHDRLHRRGAGESRLWPWEPGWFARRLPPLPARVLLGGAGAGREAKALAALGYRVDAFEPAARPAKECADVLGDRGETIVATYEDLARAVLDGASGFASSFAARAYDAVVFGWGSFGMVLRDDERERTMRAVDRLCPAGPILASVLCESPAIGVSRGEALGRTLGRRIASLRRTSAPDARSRFGGVSHVFSRDEIELLASSVGRAVIWEDAESAHFPHVTFVKDA